MKGQTEEWSGGNRGPEMEEKPGTHLLDIPRTALRIVGELGQRYVTL